MSVTISNLTATWSNTAVEYTAIKMNVANNGSAAGSKLMDLQANGNSLFTVFANGSTTIGGLDFQAATASSVKYKGYVLANTQTFTVSGTWAKPPLANATLAGTTSFAIIQAWGAGGSGGVGADTSSEGGGGGGGGFHERIIRVDDLSNTVAVTVGLGGTAISTLGVRGNPGGTSSFGDHLFAFGGGGGGTNGAGGGGGGGGGSGSAGASVTTSRSGGQGGFANAGINVSATSYRLYLGGVDVSTTIQAIGSDFYCITGANYTQNFKNGDGAFGGSSDAGTNDYDGFDSTYGGGGGGAGDDVASSGRNGGGNSVWGGGGGGGGVISGTGGPGGISTYGGNGGAGSTGSAAAVAGSEPGGGGGGSETGTSGAGANGRVIVYTFDLVL